MFLIFIAFLIPWIPIFITAYQLSKYLKFISHGGYRAEVFKDMQTKNIFRYAFCKAEFINRYKANKKVGILQKIIKSIVLGLLGYGVIGIVHILMNLSIILNIWGKGLIEWNFILPKENTLGNNIMLSIFMTFFSILYYLLPLCKLLAFNNTVRILGNLVINIFKFAKNLMIGIPSFLAFFIYSAITIWIVDFFANLVGSRLVSSPQEYQLIILILLVAMFSLYKLVISKYFIEPCLLKIGDIFPPFDEDFSTETKKKLLSNNTYLQMTLLYFLYDRILEGNIIVVALVMSLSIITYFEKKERIISKSEDKKQDCKKEMKD